MKFEVSTDKARKLEALQPSRPKRERPVFIATDWFDEIVRMVAEYVGDHMAALVVDEDVARLYPERIEALYEALPRMRVYQIKGGEDAKSMESYVKLQQFLLEQEVHRDDTIISMGGGTISDVVGFVAATFVRGVSWVNIPTTFIAQFDCAMGGKTAINLENNPNYCGTFYWPNAVFVDTTFLETLAERFFRAGVPEMAKLGLIGNEALFRRVSKLVAENDGAQGLKQELLELMIQAAQVKLDVAGRDPFQLALRIVLLMGHTTAHAIEGASKMRLHHGEAVSIGLAFESFIAEQRGLISAADRKELIDLLETCQLPTVLPAALHDRVLIEHMRLEKRNRGRMISLILPFAPGKAVEEWPAPRVLLTPDQLWDQLAAYRLACG